MMQRTPKPVFDFGVTQCSGGQRKGTYSAACRAIGLFGCVVQFA